MKEVLKLQKSQILKLSSKPTINKGTSTDATSLMCPVCELNEKVSAGLRQEVVLLKCDADVLRRQLKQSKCLLQAQQVLISDLEAGRWSPSEPQSDDGPDRTHRAPAAEWGSIFAHPSAPAAAHDTASAVDRYGGSAQAPASSSSRPPLAPGSLRYRNVADDDDDESSVDAEEQEEEQLEEQEDDEVDGEDKDHELYHEYRDARYERGGGHEHNYEYEQDRDAYGGEGDGGNGDEDAQYYDGEDIGKHHHTIHMRYGANSEGLENKKMHNNHDSDGYPHDSDGIDDNGDRSPLDADQSNTFSSSYNSDPSNEANNISANSRSSNASSSTSSSSSSSANDTSMNDESSNNISALDQYGAEEYESEYEQGQEAAKYSNNKSSSSTNNNNGSAWAQFDGNVEDSFTLIQNFYDVGKIT